ncbi:uncharacterized protein LOC129601781 [Paramacrobiotus metropolitanus]|uniref:uncharacterized protein LOC129601781 n=1 Tax=Paramacrobiotus metropolitanus TaxID=2943436 RepID=UPI0024458E39|nr:uncharacterized protein LOC129601781 [Paramacrobiotus metropolitanus]
MRDFMAVMITNRIQREFERYRAEMDPHGARFLNPIDRVAVVFVPGPLAGDAVGDGAAALEFAVYFSADEAERLRGDAQRRGQILADIGVVEAAGGGSDGDQPWALPCRGRALLAPRPPGG